MNNRQRQTLQAIFDEQANIRWSRIENLLNALGAEISEGSGSRVRVYLNQTRAVFHRPHPEPEAHRGMVRSVKKFLENAGVTL
jgi:hypothetical protein|tara:strand:+ start:2141 stop:2389 length:249 start_codon:yes stop_codon:yes gene_type:complete